MIPGTPGAGAWRERLNPIAVFCTVPSLFSANMIARALTTDDLAAEVIVFNLC